MSVLAPALFGDAGLDTDHDGFDDGEAARHGRLPPVRWYRERAFLSLTLLEIGERMRMAGMLLPELPHAHAQRASGRERDVVDWLPIRPAPARTLKLGMGMTRARLLLAAAPLALRTAACACRAP